MAAVDYRQLQAPAQVDTSLPDDGAAARAAELERTFKEFGEISGNVYNKVQTQAGAIAGAASGNTGHPQYREGLARFTAYSQAYNNAATGAYAVQAEAQADDAAARLRVQANNDPAAFATTYTAVRDAVLKQAPAQARGMLADLYNRHLATGVAAISGDQATEVKETQRKVYDEGISRATSRVATLQGSENPTDQAAAQDEHVKLSALIDGGVTAGLYSPAEAKAMHINAMREVTAQVFDTQVDRELAKPDNDKGIALMLENFRKAHAANLADTTQPPILSESEYQKLMQGATTKIREQRLLEMMLKGQNKTDEQLKFEAGDAKYSSKLFRGELTAKDLDAAVNSGDLKPEVARGLYDRLSAGVGGKGNADLYFKLHNDPGFVDMTPADFAAHVGPGGLSGKEADQLSQDAEKRRNGWEGTQASKQAKSAIDAALKIPPGTQQAALSDEQRKARTETQQEFITLQNATQPSMRDGMAQTNAQTAIEHSNQRVAREKLQSSTMLRQSAIRDHGPGSADVWDSEKMKKYLAQKDADIAEAAARAKGH